MMREAADGFDSRLRPTRGRDSGVRTGVSASGKGVKVGTAKVGTVAGPKKKPKGKAEVDVVSKIVRYSPLLTRVSISRTKTSAPPAEG